MVIAVASAVVLVRLGRSTDIAQSMLVGLAYGIAAVAWMPLYPLIRFKPEVRTLAIDELGIATTIGKLSKRVPWTEIRSIDDGEAVIALQGIRGNAFLVPARVFVSSRERAEFVHAARTWQQGTR